jgi:hypothetical protein
MEAAEVAAEAEGTEAAEETVAEIAAVTTAAEIAAVTTAAEIAKRRVRPQRSAVSRSPEPNRKTLVAITSISSRI